MTGPFRGQLMELDLAMQSQLYVGFFERELYSWIKLFSNGARSAVDVGAGHGEYTLYFLQQPNIEKVLSFEPDATERQQLVSNMTINGLESDSRLDLREAAVSRVCTASQTTLDFFQDALTPPIVLKVDIEGGEVDLLAGSNKILEHDCRWLLEVHSEELERDCLEAFKASGYETRTVDQSWWRVLIPERRPRPHNRWLLAARGMDLL